MVVVVVPGRLVVVCDGVVPIGFVVVPECGFVVPVVHFGFGIV